MSVLVNILTTYNGAGTKKAHARHGADAEAGRRSPARR